MNVISSSRFAVEVINIETDQKELIRSSGYESLYYGISWDRDYMYLGRRDLISGANSIEVLDLDLAYKDTLLQGHPALKDTHQIIVHDGTLWVTSCGNNAVVKLDPTKPREWNQMAVWYPTERYGDDYNHFNSIWFDDHKIYLIAHNKGASQLYVFEEGPDPQLVEITNMGMGAHNVAKSGGEVITFSSGDGYILTHTGRVINLHRNNYPRGVAIGDGFSIIGLSEHCTDRGVRHMERRGAVQLYTHTGAQKIVGGTHVKTIEMWKGMIFEVRGLDFPDYAHHGEPWRGRYGK